MFPGKMMLDADDIASCMTVSKGHIYNLVNKKSLPIKINHGLGDRIMVSIVQMAQYLDSRLLDSPEPAIPENEPVGKKKVGRPRGTTKAMLEVQFFQSSVRAAIYKADAWKAISDVTAFVEKFQFDIVNATGQNSLIDLEVLALCAQVKAVAVRLRQDQIELDENLS